MAEPVGVTMEVTSVPTNSLQLETPSGGAVGQFRLLISGRTRWNGCIIVWVEGTRESISVLENRTRKWSTKGKPGGTKIKKRTRKREPLDVVAKPWGPKGKKGTLGKVHREQHKNGVLV